MFQPNEYVIYSRFGVCFVEGIEHRDGQDYYCLHSIYQDCRIKTPVDGKIPIRGVITKSQANTLIDKIPSIQAKPINSSNTRELNEKYRTFVQSHWNS